MRAGSERILHKNTKTFAEIQGGLCKIKLEQLIKCDQVANIFVSIDDPKVIAISRSLNSKKIKIIKRPRELTLSSTTCDQLIKHVPEIMPDGYILWTHVTPPFVNSDIYDQLIKTYLDQLDKFDSLMAVTKLQKFLWNRSEPLNDNQKKGKWPRTQTLAPLWEVNSGGFLTSETSA